MSSLGLFNRLTVILLLIAGVLGYVVFVLWQDRQMGQHPSEGVSTPKTTQPTSRSGVYPQGLISFTPPPVDVFNEILERPLFTDGRLPPEEPEQIAAGVQPQVNLRLRLEGIATSGDKRIAVVRDQSNNELLTLQQGMQHQGWTVSEVRKDSAEFTRGKETTELEFDMQTGTKAPIPRSIPPRPSGVRKRPARR